MPYAVLLPALLAATACAHKPTVVYREAKVAVPVPCQVEQVPASDKPTASGDESIFDLAKIALARLKIVEAENVRLRAANNNPCPEPKEIAQ